VIGQAIVQPPGSEPSPGSPVSPKQAYAGALTAQAQVVEQNTVVLVFPPTPGAFGSVVVNFRNGSAPVTLDVGYGQPLSLLPLEGRLVSTVALLSGSLYYYTVTPELAKAFQSLASSPGGGQELPVALELTEDAAVAYTCPDYKRASLLRAAFHNNGEEPIVCTAYISVNESVYNILEYLTPKSGTSCGVGDTFLNPSSTADIQLPNPVPILLPGDTIYAFAATGLLVEFSLEMLEEPL
jgi:hypothetical protein